MNSKAKYVHFEKDFYVPLFARSWWLDIVSEGKWEVVILEEENLKGAWPYLTDKKFGFHRVRPPLLSKYVGPICAPGYLSALASCLPKKASWQVQCKLDQQYEDLAGWKIESAPTFVIEDCSNEQVLWSNLTTNRKRIIKKSRKQGYEIYCKGTQIKKGGQFYLNTLSREGVKGIEIELLERLYDACLNMDSGQLLEAYLDQELVASLFVVWDERYMYYLWGGSASKIHSAVFSELMFKALLLAGQKKLMFDFEGSKISGIADFFKSFGGQLREYRELSRTDSLFLKWINR